MTKPDPALIRECCDENRDRHMALIEAIQSITRNIDLSRKDKK